MTKPSQMYQMEEPWAYRVLVRNKWARQLYTDIHSSEHIQNVNYTPK